MNFSDEITPDTPKTVSGKLTLEFFNARPTTVYTPYLNGVEVSSSVKPWGKKLNGEIKTDDSGYVSIELFYEIPAQTNFSFDNVENDALKEKDPTNRLRITNWLFELRSGTSTVFKTIPVRLLVKPS